MFVWNRLQPWRIASVRESRELGPCSQRCEVPMEYRKRQPVRTYSMSRITTLCAVAICLLIMASAVAQDHRTEQVVYTTLAPHGWDILMFESSSGTARPLASDPALEYDPTFSPDGRWMVFTSEQRGNPDLWALNLTADGGPILLTPGDTMQDAAAFSPDGRSIAFVDTRDGNAEIYIMPFRPHDLVTEFRAAQSNTIATRRFPARVFTGWAPHRLL